MALPTFVAVGTPAAGTGAVVPGLPAGSTTNDVMILAVESNSSQPAAAPTDWTEFPDSPQDEGGLGSTCLSAFWKRHDGSETDPTVADTGNHTYAVITSYRGCITTGDPFDVTAGDVANTSTTAVSVPGDTTTVADCLIVGLACHGTDAAAGTAEFDNTWANASLANLTEWFDNCTDVGAGGGLGIFTGEKATAGAVSATTATLDTASEQGRIFIALKPPAGGTAHSLAGTITGDSSSAGALKRGVLMAGAANGTSSVTGAIGLGFFLAGTTTGTSSTAGVLKLGAGLAGVTAGDSSVTGALIQGHRLVGESTGTSMVTGYMTNEWLLAGSSVGTSSVTGNLFQLIAGASVVSTNINFVPIYLLLLRKRT